MKYKYKNQIKTEEELLKLNVIKQTENSITIESFEYKLLQVDGELKEQKVKYIKKFRLI